MNTTELRSRFERRSGSITHYKDGAVVVWNGEYVEWLEEIILQRDAYNNERRELEHERIKRGWTQQEANRYSYINHKLNNTEPK